MIQKSPRTLTPPSTRLSVSDFSKSSPEFYDLETDVDDRSSGSSSYVVALEEVADVVSLPARKPRLTSLDVLRGFDMIWILGLEQIWAGLFLVTGSPSMEAAAAQFVHTEWNGFTMYDLIFPLFIFMSGAVIGVGNKRYNTVSSCLDDGELWSIVS